MTLDSVTTADAHYLSGSWVSRHVYGEGDVVIYIVQALGLYFRTTYY